MGVLDHVVGGWMGGCWFLPKFLLSWVTNDVCWVFFSQSCSGCCSPPISGAKSTSQSANPPIHLEGLCCQVAHSARVNLYW